jgi:hypothetical protein
MTGAMRAVYGFPKSTTVGGLGMLVPVVVLGAIFWPCQSPLRSTLSVGWELDFGSRGRN